MLNRHTHILGICTQKSRKKVLFLLSFALFFFCVCFIDVAHAQENDVATAAWGAADWLLKPVADLLFGIALGIGGLFVGIGGLALDQSLWWLVIKMGTLFRGTFGVGIIELWKIARDFLNIIFIFSFIYLGIKTILNSEDANTRKRIGLLIAAALLINFSLYITLAIVDFSNIAATQIFNQITSAGSLSGAVDNQYLQLGEGSITGSFLNAANITSFFGGSGELSGMNTLQTIIYAIFMMIFFIFAGLIFLVAAIMLIYRFIALSLYVLFSPVMFLGWILPNFASYTSKWWSGFLKNSFYAPAFLFLIYVSLLLMHRLKGPLLDGANGDYTALFKGGQMNANEFTIMLFFGMMIGFLYASIKVGDMMSVAGAKTSMKIVDNARRGAQGFAYRNTAGRGFAWGVKRMDSLDRSAEKGSRGARITRALIGGESTRKALEKASNYGAGGAGRADVEKMDKERTARATRGNQIADINAAIEAGQGAPKGEAGDATRIAMERKVQGASSSQITDMVKDDKDIENVKKVAGLLSESQAKAIMDDKEIDDATKKTVAEERARQITERLTDNGDKEMADVIGKADLADLKAVGYETALQYAGKLSSKQIDDWKDLTPTEKARLKETRKQQLEKEFGKGTDGSIDGSGNKALFDRLKNDDERAKLPDTILTHEGAAPFINTNVLTKIVDNSGITEENRKTIKKNVLDYWSVTDAEIHRKFAEWFDRNNAGQRY